MPHGSARDVLVSTTPTLEGWEITSYFGAVSSHVVAGTNIFSDIAASWRDIFGGRSESYKKQLEQINEKVVGDLKEEATQRGANALVGLQIDHDQISGQGKEMFMVTASATAVKAESISESDSAGGQDGSGPITAREMDVEVRKEKLLEKHGNGEFQFTDENWRFLIENQIADFAGIVQATLAKVLQATGPTAAEKQRKHLDPGRDYFLSISEEKAKEHLYEMVSHEHRKVMDWAVDVLEDGNMLDLSRIESMLDGDFDLEQKPALEVLSQVDKPYYEKEDIERLQGIKNQIERGFEKRGEVLEIEESGMFSSSEKQVWQIEDGVHNPMDQKYCEETGKDIYGFSRGETGPDDAIKILNRKITALQRRFGSV